MDVLHSDDPDDERDAVHAAGSGGPDPEDGDALEGSEMEDSMEDEEDGSEGSSGTGQPGLGIDTGFEELVLPAKMIEDMRNVWQTFLEAQGTPQNAGEAIYGAIFDSAPTLQRLFKTPRAMQAMRFMDGLVGIATLLDDPPILKQAAEMLAFQHLGIDVTEPRSALFRDAILELIAEAVPNIEDTQAKEGWTRVLNWIAHAFIFIREENKERLEILASSWAEVNLKDKSAEGGVETSPKDNARQSGNDASAEVGIQQVPVTFKEMFHVNAAVMGYGSSRWMAEVLSRLDSMVTHAVDSKRLQDECSYLALVLTGYKRSIHLQEFGAVMLAALRSLLPQSWNSSHEVAWTWFWGNMAAMLQECLGKPAKQNKALDKLFNTASPDDLENFRNGIYTTFFEKCSAGQEYFKQSATRLHFIADRILALTREIFSDPKRTIDEISAVGLRHVGYGIPVEMFGPFVSSCVEEVRKIGIEDDSEEAFRWSLGLVSRVLIRTIEEGSTIVMRAINADSARDVRKAVSCAPRAERALWALRVQVGSQSISPLMWAMKSGATEAARAILQDLLTIRADRDSYYYAVNDLFERHPDIVHRLCVDAPTLLPTLLDGLIWRSSQTHEGRRRVNYYVENLIVDKFTVGLSRSFVRLVEFGDPELVCHPALLTSLNLLWSGVAFWAFLRGKAWFIFSLMVFVFSQAILEPAEVALAYTPHPPNMPRVVGIVAGRTIIYIFIFGQLVYHHSQHALRDLRSRCFVQVWRIWVPAYLSYWYEVITLLLTLTLIMMLWNEPVLSCLLSDEFANAEGEEKIGLIIHCSKIDTEAHIGYVRYTTFSTIAVFLYFFLILDMHSLSETLSAFALVCGRLAWQLGLYLCAYGFILLMFACGLGALNQGHPYFVHLEEGLAFLIKLTTGFWSSEDYARAMDGEFLQIAVLHIYMLISNVFFINVLVAQLAAAYNATFENMLGYARLCRGRILVKAIAGVSEKRWERFVASLDFSKRLEFNEGDLGPSGGIATTEPAMDHPQATDKILRYGGTMSPSAPWPEVQERSDEDRLERLEKTLTTAMRRIGRLLEGKVGSVSGSGMSDSFLVSTAEEGLHSST